MIPGLRDEFENRERTRRRQPCRRFVCISCTHRPPVSTFFRHFGVPTLGRILPSLICEAGLSSIASCYSEKQVGAVGPGHTRYQGRPSHNVGQLQRGGHAGEFFRLYQTRDRTKASRQTRKTPGEADVRWLLWRDCSVWCCCQAIKPVFRLVRLEDTITTPPGQKCASVSGPFGCFLVVVICFLSLGGSHFVVCRLDTSKLTLSETHNDQHTTTTKTPSFVAYLALAP